MQRQLPYSIQHWLKCALILCLGLVLSACHRLPPRMPVQSSYYLTNTADTQLGHLLEPQKAQHKGLTGYQLLIDPIGAIAARLILIEKAQKSLDLQYYIWHNDKVGALTLEALLRAADRGVRVRLLLDDNNTDDLDSSLLALSQHPNIEVRLFNPFVYRKWRVLNYVLDLKRNNRRMHNKTFIADSQVALIGGRNISNQYYDAGESFQFSDIDVLLVGKVVPEIAQSFDSYWNYPMAYPAQQMIDAGQHSLNLAQLRRQLEDYHATIPAQNYLELAKEQAEFNNWLGGQPQLEWVPAHLVQDSPEKIDKHTNRDEHLGFQLQNLVGEPSQQLDIISAYFVPANTGTAALIRLKKKGVRVRVLTNSYAANDVGIVHAFYAKRRKELIKNGIELYEFLPQLKTVQRRYFRKDRIRLLGSNSHSANTGSINTGSGIGDSSDASLHAKMMVFDRQQAFIGSFNFDPRSANLNTEIGVILDSPKLATQVSQDLDNSILSIAYRVRLDENGKMIWEEKTPEGIKIHTREPNIKPVTRVGLKMIAKLPLDGFM
ncbi:phospholipase D family protein [Alkanindiges sp. WGS2144]|uniref:phospholipase D family protein n=1 Tax=Alkanindiges sp. WGS2144 TaxID=3366808 RepID=UPI003750F933